MTASCPDGCPCFHRGGTQRKPGTPPAVRGHPLWLADPQPPGHTWPSPTCPCGRGGPCNGSSASGPSPLRAASACSRSSVHPSTQRSGPAGHTLSLCPRQPCSTRPLNILKYQNENYKVCAITVNYGPREPSLGTGSALCGLSAHRRGVGLLRKPGHQRGPPTRHAGSYNAASEVCT